MQVAGNPSAPAAWGPWCRARSLRYGQGPPEPKRVTQVSLRGSPGGLRTRSARELAGERQRILARLHPAVEVRFAHREQNPTDGNAFEAELLEVGPGNRRAPLAIFLSPAVEPAAARGLGSGVEREELLFAQVADRTIHRAPAS